MTQKKIADLFGVGIPAINKHLKNIFESGELVEDSVISKMETTAEDGKTYSTKFYNLDAIISVGYRINSERGTQFGQWATEILKNYTKPYKALAISDIQRHYVWNTITNKRRKYVGNLSQ